MPDTSPTKSASFFPDTWYRKAYEENTRSGTRPAPEGAGSMPSSTGTPSPGSGISSPGSFSGSPGTISPGIGTESPGSLGGSPGFGTGSPASGSGSSPGSERGIWCENCNARLAELKGQALKLLIPGPYSSKDPSFSLLLHDKLQVPNSSRRAWNERDSRCDVCATHLTQLKQEAVRMVLTLDQWDLSPPSSPPALFGRYGSQGPTGPGSREWIPAFLPSSSSSAGHRLGSKPSSLGLGGGVDRRNGSPSSGKAVAQPVTGVNSTGNNSVNGSGAVLSTTALQAHQHLNRTNGGVTLYPYQISQMISEDSREGLTEAALNRYNTNSPSHTNSTSHTNSPSHTTAVTTTVPTTTTSAAASFFAR
uniref:Kinesin-like protein KIF26A/B helical domain-containing protein n=1 Tax=Cyclopterus lumpus TaxID=8103 RepID=A0A8C2WKS2_CYCLU